MLTVAQEAQDSAMNAGILRSEQPITAKRPRGPGRPFEKGDARINRHGVPRESLAFQKHLRKALAQELQRPSDSNGEMTKFQGLVARLVKLAESGVPWAVQTVFDRIGGKPVQPIAEQSHQEVKVRVIELVGFNRAKQLNSEGGATER